MKEPPKEPLDEETRLALFEAIARLEEGPRGLLLDHYVEGETLESLGSRDGVSPQAVSKRLERAREELKRTLPAGFLVLPDLKRLFPPAPASPDLVSGPVLAKVHSIATLTAAGGAFMAAKSSMSGVVILVAVLLLATGTAVTVLVRRKPAVEKKPAVGIQVPVRPSETASDETRATPASEPVADPTAAPPATTSPLRARLDRFKKWWTGIQEDQALARADGEKWGEFQKRWDQELWDHVAGLRELILEDPEGFLAFLGDRDNEAVLRDLTRMGLLTQTDKPHVHFTTPFNELPQSLTRGLLQLLQSGSNLQKSATVSLLGGRSDLPQEYKNVYLILLEDPDPELRDQVIGPIVSYIPMTPALFSKLTALGTNSENLFTRLRVVSSIAGLQSPESEAFVLNRLTVATHQNELMQITFSLDMRYQAARRSGTAIQEDLLARALSETMARDDPFYLHYLMPVATHLSGDRLKPILLQAMGRAKEDWYRDRMAKAVERIDQGPFTRDDLMKILDPPRQR